MREIFTFLQDIFMIKESKLQAIGLSQFRDDIPVSQPAEKSIRNKNIKLSDLMRRS